MFANADTKSMYERFEAEMFSTMNICVTAPYFVYPILEKVVEFLVFGNHQHSDGAPIVRVQVNRESDQCHVKQLANVAESTEATK